MWLCNRCTSHLNSPLHEQPVTRPWPEAIKLEIVAAFGEGHHGGKYFLREVFAAG
jgi:hypothetical protein